MNKQKIKVHYIKFILRSYISLLMIPVTILTVIISMYGQVFDSILRNEKQTESYSLQSFIDYFTNREINNNTGIPLTPIEISDDTTSYNHLLIIDRTRSTDNPRFQVKVSRFSPDLKKALDKDGYNWDSSPKGKNDALNINQLVIYRIYHQYMNCKNTRNFLTVFYNGNSKEKEKFSYPELKKFETGNYTNWAGVNKSNKDLLINLLAEHSLMVSLEGQRTDFNDIIDKIKNHLNIKNIIVTIISDFNHDEGQITVRDIEKLQQGDYTPIQYNLIYIPPTNILEKERSDQLVNLFYEEFQGLVCILPIKLEEYTNEHYEEDLYTKFNFELSRCLFSSCKENSQIIFNYPYNNNLTYQTAQCKIKIKNFSDTLSYRWRITTPYLQTDAKNCFASFKTTGQHKIEKRLNINKWYTLSPQDTLNLNFGLNASIHSNQYNFEINNSQCNKIYPIQFSTYIPTPIIWTFKGMVYLILGLILLWAILQTYLTTVFMMDSLNKTDSFEYLTTRYSLQGLCRERISIALCTALVTTCLIYFYFHYFLLILGIIIVVCNFYCIVNLCKVIKTSKK